MLENNEEPIKKYEEKQNTIQKLSFDERYQI